MATYSGQGINIGHLVADVDMATHQWKFVTTASSAGKFKRATGGCNPMPIGVLQDNPQAGLPGDIRVYGSTKVSASGTIGFGDFVGSGSHGLATLVNTASATAAGIALSAITSGSGYIEVLLMPITNTGADNTP